MKLLLLVSRCICALASLWGAVAVCGHVVSRAPRSLDDGCSRHPYPLCIYGALPRGVRNLRRLLVVGIQKNRKPTPVARSSPPPPGSLKTRNLVVNGTGT
jgi:hypothetical protein